jgi:hypothetical protein
MFSSKSSIVFHYIPTINRDISLDINTIQGMIECCVNPLQTWVANSFECLYLTLKLNNKTLLLPNNLIKVCVLSEHNSTVFCYSELSVFPIGSDSIS